MIDQELAFSSAIDLIKLIKTKQISPTELLELYFERINKLNPKLNSYINLTYSKAIEEAKIAEKSIIDKETLGPLHGLPIAIKDTQMTKGVLTTMGSVIFKDNIPKDNAAVVEKVLDSGSIMIGKTNVPELGLVGNCENSIGIEGFNPWDISKTPGGSSGGAAASVAAGLAPIATGSDGGGSIRIPSSFCGVYGIKPTFGRVSGYTGQYSSLPNFGSQNGPISRTVKDAALLLEVMSGYDSRDHFSLRETPPNFTKSIDKNIKGLKIAFSKDFGFANVHPEVLGVVSNAAKLFESLGCNVEEFKLNLQNPYVAFCAVHDFHFFQNFNKYLDKYNDQLTDFVKFAIEKGSKVKLPEYSKAINNIYEQRATINDIFFEYDLLISPVSCFPAFSKVSFEEDSSQGFEYPPHFFNGDFTFHINISGNPAASIPAGFSSEKMPIGLHIIGSHGDEETVLAASAAFEKSQPWLIHKPSVS